MSARKSACIFSRIVKDFATDMLVRNVRNDRAAPVESRRIAEGIRSRIRPALERIYVEEVIYARIEAIAGSRGCDPFISRVRLVARFRPLKLFE